MPAALAKAYVYTLGPLPMWVPLTIIAIVIAGLVALFVLLRNR